MLLVEASPYAHHARLKKRPFSQALLDLEGRVGNVNACRELDVEVNAVAPAADACIGEVDGPSRHIDAVHASSNKTPDLRSAGRSAHVQHQIIDESRKVLRNRKPTVATARFRRTEAQANARGTFFDTILFIIARVVSMQSSC